MRPNATVKADNTIEQPNIDISDVILTYVACSLFEPYQRPGTAPRVSALRAVITARVQRGLGGVLSALRRRRRTIGNPYGDFVGHGQSTSVGDTEIA